ncbi:hypothetical protein GGS21DRAFT_497263 [Xylaria nigripes]|nr:hypothetical protein GGS21DRAFT_497263 [Xylaria nigripes]
MTPEGSRLLVLSFVCAYSLEYFVTPTLFRCLIPLEGNANLRACLALTGPDMPGNRSIFSHSSCGFLISPVLSTLFPSRCCPVCFLGHSINDHPILMSDHSLFTRRAAWSNVTVTAVI